MPRPAIDERHTRQSGRFGSKSLKGIEGPIRRFWVRYPVVRRIYNRCAWKTPIIPQSRMPSASTGAANFSPGPAAFDRSLGAIEFRWAQGPGFWTEPQSRSPTIARRCPLSNIDPSVPFLLQSRPRVAFSRSTRRGVSFTPCEFAEGRVSREVTFAEN